MTDSPIPISGLMLRALREALAKGKTTLDPGYATVLLTPARRPLNVPYQIPSRNRKVCSPYLHLFRFLQTPGRALTFLHETPCRSTSGGPRIGRKPCAGASPDSGGQSVQR